MVAARCAVPSSFGDWRELVRSDDVDAVAIAVTPLIQPDIAVEALELGKPVFCEKPLAAALEPARRLAAVARRSGSPTAVDFLFPEIPSWQQAKTILENGDVGKVRYVTVDWSVETYANRKRTESWKTTASLGGGALNNFCSHTLYYLEWLLGPIRSMSASRFRAADDAREGETAVTLRMDGVGGLGIAAHVNTAAQFMHRHRIEVFGESGTLVLENREADYVSGFRLWLAQNGAETLSEVPCTPTPRGTDGRVMAVSAIASRFLDSILHGSPLRPTVADGLRVQELLDAASRAFKSRTVVEV